MGDATEFKSAFPDSEDEDVAAGSSDIEVKQEDDEDQAGSADELEAVTKPSTKKAKAVKAEKTIETPPSLHERIKDITFDEDLLPGWKDQALHPLLKKSLFALGFSRPSDIQARAVPVGIQPGKDVVGVAETVSIKFHAEHCKLS
jgi:ATP-dependent RNA helicase DDX24/MAK5